MAVASFWRVLMGKSRRDAEAGRIKRESEIHALAVKASIQRSRRAVDEMVEMLLKDKHNAD